MMERGLERDKGNTQFLRQGHQIADNSVRESLSIA